MISKTQLKSQLWSNSQAIQGWERLLNNLKGNCEGAALIRTMKERNTKGGTACMVGWRECGLIWSRSSGQAPLKMRCYNWDLYLVRKTKGRTGLGWVQNVQRSWGSRKPVGTWRVVRAAQGTNEVSVRVMKPERGGRSSQHLAPPAQKCRLYPKSHSKP